MIPEIPTPQNGGARAVVSQTNNENASPPDALPNSKKVYISGQLHPDIRVPFREISLAPTKTMSGEIEVNEPVRVYDTSGPWGDPSVTLDPIQGLPPLRRDWILKRGDVEEIDGRAVQPIDDGYLSETHAVACEKQTPNAQRRTSNVELRTAQAPNSKLQARKLARGQSPAIASRNWLTRGMESSRRKWSSSRFGKTTRIAE